MESWRTLLGYPSVEVYNGLNLSDLPLNYAYGIVNTNLSDVGIYTVSDYCAGCPYTLQKRLQHGDKSNSWIFDTSVPATWKIMNSGNLQNISRITRRGLLCQLRPSTGEFGVYSLDIGVCKLTTELEPINSYLAFIMTCFVLVTIGCVYSALKILVERRRMTTEKSDTESADVKKPEPLKNTYMTTLYVFRGLLLSLIIFLTTGGGGYPLFLRNWGGFTVADCLFYGFVWSIGFKIPTTVDKAFDSGHTKCRMFTDILKRSSSLIVIGLVIESTVQKIKSDPLSLWCPLQRLGIAYFISALAYALTVQRFKIKSKSVFCKAMGLFFSLLWSWIIAGFFCVLLVISFSAFVSFNCQYDIGLESPTSDPSSIYDLQSKCSGDVTELANNVLMADPQPILYVNSYYGFSRGLMGILATIIQCMIGLKSGAVYHQYDNHGDRLKLWGLWATFFSVSSLIVMGLSIPFRFNLWPPSSILLIAVGSMLVFAALYTLLEIYNFASLGVLKSFGVTSLVVISGHLLFSKSIPFYWNMVHNTHMTYLLQNLWILSLWLVIGVILMKKRVRFSV